MTWNERLSRSVKFLQRFADRWWYPPLIGLLAAVDNLLLFVPNDGILISSSMLRPKRWFAYGAWITIGSTVGALLLATLVETQGLPWILDMYPGVNETETWHVTFRFFKEYGLLLVFAVAVTPLMQQPAVILASLANTPMLKLVTVIFLGRFIKYLLMAYIGSHAPHLLKKMWGVKGELKQSGWEEKDS